MPCRHAASLRHFYITPLRRLMAGFMMLVITRRRHAPRRHARCRAALWLTLDAAIDTPLDVR